MKKLIGLLAVVTFASCNNGESTNAATENPTAIEDTSTQHGNGITTGNVISTDTSKFDVKSVNQDSLRKVRQGN